MVNSCADTGTIEFGIGFINEQHGFVGTVNTGYKTTDGGTTWMKVNIGRAANKIRIYDAGKTLSLYAIGVSVYHTTIPKLKNTRK